MRKIRTLFSFSFFIFSSVITYGQLWGAVGSGITGSHEPVITAMAVYKDELYVAGEFDSAGGQPAENIAKWDGTKWSAVGLGISGRVSVEITAMAVYKNELYVAGEFEKADGKEAYCIAKWNDTNWNAVDTDWIYLKVNALAVYKDLLYIAGESLNTGKTLIESWDGNSLKNAGIGEEYTVNTMCVYKDELYAAGTYADTNYSYASKIPHWNGDKWTYDWVGTNKVYGKFKTILAYNGMLYAGGYCGIPGHDVMYSQDIVEYDSANWNSLDLGLNARSSPARRIEHRNIVYALAGYNGSVYAGGNFNSAGNDTIYGIARWNGQKWISLDQGLVGSDFDSFGNVYSMIEYKGWLYVGGEFNTAGDKKVNNIAKWHSQK